LLAYPRDLPFFLASDPNRPPKQFLERVKTRPVAPEEPFELPDYHFVAMLP